MRSCPEERNFTREPLQATRLRVQSRFSVNSHKYLRLCGTSLSRSMPLSWGYPVREWPHKDWHAYHHGRHRPWHW